MYSSSLYNVKTCLSFCQQFERETCFLASCHCPIKIFEIHLWVNSNWHLSCTIRSSSLFLSRSLARVSFSSIGHYWMCSFVTKYQPIDPEIDMYISKFVQCPHCCDICCQSVPIWLLLWQVPDWIDACGCCCWESIHNQFCACVRVCISVSLTLDPAANWCHSIECVLCVAFGNWIALCVCVLLFLFIQRKKRYTELRWLTNITNKSTRKKKLDNFSLIFSLVFFLIEYYQFINENESVYYLFEVRT